MHATATKLRLLPDRRTVAADARPAIASERRRVSRLIRSTYPKRELFANPQRNPTESVDGPLRSRFLRFLCDLFDFPPFVLSRGNSLFASIGVPMPFIGIRGWDVWDRNRIFQLSHHCKPATCVRTVGTLSQTSGSRAYLRKLTRTSTRDSGIRHPTFDIGKILSSPPRLVRRSNEQICYKTMTPTISANSIDASSQTIIMRRCRVARRCPKIRPALETLNIAYD